MVTEVKSPVHAVLSQWCTEPGRLVCAGDVLAILEVMKMEHEIAAPCDAIVRALCSTPGELVEEGAVLVKLERSELRQAKLPQEIRQYSPDHRRNAVDPLLAYEEDAARPDLQRVLDRLAFIEDGRRPEAMNRRHALGLRSGRENVQDVCDPGTPFNELGAMAIAAQRGRRSLEELIENTPADGLITGIGSVNSHSFPADKARTAIMAYDPTVLAGTQGKRGHQKADRILQIAWVHRLPLVLFAEGGGGRPGDDDMPVVAGLHMTTFSNFARLNGRVPTVGIAAGRCFAGNAALLGCCDMVIATRGSNIGMGGPAMVEGGGLGVFTPEQIGPASVQYGNGVVDALVDDEAEAVVVARKYLSFFQGDLTTWIAPDPYALRDVVPENRLRAYDSVAAMTGLVDVDSLLPLRQGFGRSIHTAFGRIEGRTVGLIASNPRHLGGAIDADAADKAARFMRLCNHYGFPVVSLIDTPGFMIGPDMEEHAQVRHTSRMFIAAAHLRTSFFAIVMRKAYGLGAMALTAGGFHEPCLTVSWPTGEFGGMGVEGYVRLGYRRELEAIPAGPEREALFQRLVQERYEAGSPINMATTLEIDAVIDPAETRSRLTTLLAGAPKASASEMGCVDAW